MLRCKKSIVVGVLSLSISRILFAGYFPTPITAPDDSSAFLQFAKENRWAAGILYEEGSGGGGFDGSSEHKHLGALYSPYESLLTMLRNPRGDVATKLGASPYRILQGAPDFGGRRGSIDIRGNLYQRQVTLATSCNLSFIKIIPGFVDLSFYLPFVTKKFDDIKFNKKAATVITPADVALNNLTNDISAALQSLGNLRVDPWYGSGLGDPALLLRWNWPHDLDQGEIKKAFTYLYFGFQIPVSKARDVDQLFSQPLGNDGHWGIPFGGGFDVAFDLPIKIGCGIDLLWSVAESQDIRVKTDVSQTSLLLLHKIRALRKPGLTWRLNWFAQAYRVWRGLSLKAAYQFAMHHNDELVVNQPGYKTEIANTDPKLQNWFLNLLTLSARYDLNTEFAQAPVTPSLEGFLKFPVSGRRAVNANTVGFQVMIRF